MVGLAGEASLVPATALYSSIKFLPNAIKSHVTFCKKCTICPRQSYYIMVLNQTDHWMKYSQTTWICFFYQNTLSFFKVISVPSETETKYGVITLNTKFPLFPYWWNRQNTWCSYQYAIEKHRIHHWSVHSSEAEKGGKISNYSVIVDYYLNTIYC